MPEGYASMLHLVCKGDSFVGLLDEFARDRRYPRTQLVRGTLLAASGDSESEN